jgi:hypothetical protein
VGTVVTEPHVTRTELKVMLLMLGDGVSSGTTNSVAEDAASTPDRESFELDGIAPGF